MMAMSDLADRQRRQRDARSPAGSPGRRAGPPRSGAYVVSVDVDVVVVGAGPAGSCAATVLARAGHSVVLARAWRVPRREEHVRRRRVPAHPRPAPPRVVGRGAGATMGHPSLDDDPHRRPGAHGRLPLGDVGPPAVQRCHRLPPRLGPLAGRRRPRPTVRTSCVRPPPPACCATNAAVVVGVTTDRPDGDITARLVIACDGVNSFLAKEAGLYGAGRRGQLHARREGDASACRRT